MIIQTKDFQEVANKILVAVGADSTVANLELVAAIDDPYLYLNVTNREFYVSVKFPITMGIDFRAVVDAASFLNLINGITTETFELSINGNTVILKSGKSKYKLAMIYENDKLMELPGIVISNKTIEMTISNDILQSILNVNSKEIQKVKAMNLNELQKLYYIDETGCFTFTTGAVLNAFNLEKPVKLLLNDRIVKLFKLFKTDVYFAFGHDADATGNIRTKIAMEDKDGTVCMAAYITCDDLLIKKVQGPFEAAKQYINDTYPINAVVSVAQFSAAINRLMMFTKHTVNKQDMLNIPMTIRITDSELSITDEAENAEVITLDNDSRIVTDYTMKVNIVDFKYALESCKMEHITMRCGNRRSVIVCRGNISTLIREYA